jgi:hypothetical protein
MFKSRDSRVYVQVNYEAEGDLGWANEGTVAFPKFISRVSMSKSHSMIELTSTPNGTLTTSLLLQSPREEPHNGYSKRTTSPKIRILVRFPIP